MFKFIHVADVHLDSPLKGLQRYDGAPVDQIRHATRRALERLVETAVDEQVAMVLIAGDLYDGDWRDYNTGLFFVSQMTQLRQAGIRVVLVAGNHDAANRMTRSLRLPENVSFLSSHSPETVHLEDLGVAVHGQSFKTAAVFDDLAQAYPAAQNGCFNIGLLHTCATGLHDDLPYAPCTLDTLRSKQYNYWALGHVHKREILCRDPFVAFSGNLQGRHIRESGPKGCLLVTVDDDLSLRAEPEFRPLDVLRWQQAVVDVGGSRTLDEVLTHVTDHLAKLHQEAAGRPTAVRVELTGSTSLHERLAAERAHWAYEIRSHAIDVGAGEIWVEKIRFRTTAPRDAPANAGGPLSELTSLIRELRSDPEGFQTLRVDFADLIRKLPAELTHALSSRAHDPSDSNAHDPSDSSARDPSDTLRLDDPECIRSLLDAVEPLLAGRLLGKDATS